MKYIALLALCAQILGAQTFQVKRLKRLWWDGEGQVEITQNGITYKAKKPKHSRSWKYEDIQYFDRISPKEFVILSYEDIGWQLGRDREYRFAITSGELTDEALQTVAKRLDKPVTDRVVGEVAGAKYEIPVKHLHTLGGCEGELMFTGNSIYYATKHKEDGREWLVARDIQSVWSMNPYEFEIHAYDNNRREFSHTRIYKFALKRPLNAEFYRALKLRLYDLESAHLLMK